MQRQPQKARSAGRSHDEIAGPRGFDDLPTVAFGGLASGVAHRVRIAPAKLSRGPTGLAPDQRLAFSTDNRLGDIDMKNILAARHVVHHVQHEPLKQAA